ncbi:MAG TPA: hypothetical protein VI076_04700, partial [Actinopolymorphaceae bacterium]
AAALVVAARALGARLVPADLARTDDSRARPAPDGRTFDASANYVGAGRRGRRGPSSLASVSGSIPVADRSGCRGGSP